MNTFSQAHQDLFVLSVLDGKRGGTYLDLGCFDPVSGNNTYLLDVEYGWGGVSVDHVEQDFSKSRRKGGFIVADTTKPYPDELVRWAFSVGSSGIDYLSLDVDEATNASLKQALALARYKVITIEHDLYARGKENQKWQRDVLIEAGYKLQVANIYPPGQPELPFEDWWVAPWLYDHAIATSPQNDAKEFVEEFWRYKFGADIQ